jgi:hypothetical protein
MANPNFPTQITASIDAYKNILASNVINNNALLKAMQSRGNIIFVQGGNNFRKNVTYAQNSTIQFQGATDTIDTTPQNEFTAVTFAPKLITGSTTTTDVEILQNRGSAAIINLVKERLKNLNDSMKNKIGSALYGDGTADAGQSFGGLQLLVADDPTTGTVGGVDRSLYPIWRNQLYDFSVESVTPSVTTFKDSMNTMFLRCQAQEGELPDLILADAKYYSFYENSSQQIQRIATADEGNIGYATLKYKNQDVVYDPNCPAEHMYFINTKHVFFEHLTENLFKILDTVRPFNQLVYNTPVALFGNLTIDNARVHGVMHA